MATPKRARATSSTTRSKKAAAMPEQVITAQSTVSEEAIRVRAYQLFEQRGCTHGADMEDWLRAESDLRKNGAHPA